MSCNKDSTKLSEADRQFVERAMNDEVLKKSLTSGLARARQEYDSNQQAAWCFALDTTVNFLKAIGVKPQLIGPLNSLSSALNDLQYGIVDGGLKPAQFEGGPRIPLNKFLNLVMAAVLITLLHEDACQSMSLDQATEEASKLSGIEKGRLTQFRKNTLAGRRSWKAHEFYFIRLRHLRANLSPEQRIS
jgi:hypothetical protein